MYGQVLYRDRTFGIDEESEGLGWTKVGWLLILIFFWTKSLKIYIPLFPTKVIYMLLARYACIFPPPPFYI
jgi:hypothetical protein